MSDSTSSPLFRPVIVGIVFFVFFYVFLITKGRDAGATKLALAGSWVLGVVAVIVFQAVRKKAFGWGGAIAGALGFTFLAGVIISSIKTG